MRGDLPKADKICKLGALEVMERVTDVPFGQSGQVTDVPYGQSGQVTDVPFGQSGQVTDVPYGQSGQVVLPIPPYVASGHTVIGNQ